MNNQPKLTLSKKVNREKCAEGIANMNTYAVTVMKRLKFNEMEHVKAVRSIQNDDDNLRLKIRLKDGAGDKTIIIGKDFGFKYKVSLQEWNETLEMCTTVVVADGVRGGELDSTVGRMLEVSHAPTTRLNWGILRKSRLEKFLRTNAMKGILFDIDNVVTDHENQIIIKVGGQEFNRVTINDYNGKINVVSGTNSKSLGGSATLKTFNDVNTGEIINIINSLV